MEEALELEDSQPEKAEGVYLSIINDKTLRDTEGLKKKEDAVNMLGKLYCKTKASEKLQNLLVELRPLFDLIPKARTAKIVRTILDLVEKIPNTEALQVKLCLDTVQWAREEKRTFLRQRVEARLVALYLGQQNYQSAVNLVSSLLSEVKKLDDKLLLVEIHLLESRAHHALRNMPKSKAGLTAARTAANAIYVPPSLQGMIDVQSGTLHAEEKDYKTAYSYFYEAFEQFSSLDDSKAISCLKYMLLCKVMTNQAEDINAIVSTKAGLKYAGDEVEAMKAVASAYLERSLESFENALKSHTSQLSGDPIIHSHLSALYDTMLEQNICRLIEPYSCVEVEHIARLINLPVPTVEDKLSQMILDHKFKGTLDQGNGCLIIFDDPDPSSLYSDALGAIENMSKVVDHLSIKSQKILK